MEKIVIGNATLFLGDCMEGMKEMPDKSFDLAIVDPPYGINVNSMNMGSRQTIKPDSRKWDDCVPNNQYFKELQRISKNQIIWGGNYFNLPPTRCFIVWDKGESMYGRSFAECELAWTSFDRSAKIYKINPIQLDRIHVTQKPEKLYRRLLQDFAECGQTIIDTHHGSGSNAIACLDMGFSITAYEIDPEYFYAACERIERAQQQLKLAL